MLAAGQVSIYVSIYENEAHKTIYLASDGVPVIQPSIKFMILRSSRHCLFVMQVAVYVAH
jgi:hypothetical protein